MRIRNRVLAIMASGGVVAGACTGETNTTSGKAVTADFSDYSVIRMYAVYTRDERGHSIDLYPFDGPDIRARNHRLDSAHSKSGDSRGHRVELPDFADESVNRYLNISMNTEVQGLPGAVLRRLMGARPHPEPTPLDLPGTRAVQIGQWVVPRPPRESLDYEHIAQLFEIEFGWQVPEGAREDREPTKYREPRREYVPAQGGVLLFGLGGLITRRRRS